MHVELVVPGLFQAQAAAPALELLLARGRRTEHPEATLEQWYARAFGLGDTPLPAGALTAHAAGADAGGHWLRADPVHLRADRDRLLLVPSAAFGVAGDEANALCAALNQHYAGQFALQAFGPEHWGLRAAEPMPLAALPPVELAGRDVDAALPDKRFHALLNEIQMALYQHPVNTAREARGEPVVNSVWLWGAGALPAAAKAGWQSVSAEDPVALGLGKLAGLRYRTPGAGASSWLERAPEDGRHLVVLDRLRAAAALGDPDGLARGLAALEKDWFEPLLAALRASRVGMVTVQVPDGGAAFETIRGDLRRFWRRPRPAVSYAAARP
jgi:hypothetical protein